MKHEVIGAEQCAPKQAVPRIIVSFTSYPARIHVVKQVLDSLYAQTMRADAILLWLAEEQFPGREGDLPEALQADLDERKFEVRWCDDLGSHKKYFYALQEFPDDIVITVDDDTLYHPRTIETLFLSYRNNPEAVSALLAYAVIFDNEDEIVPFARWLSPCSLRVGKPSMQLVATGMGGVLYPSRRLLDHRVFDKEAVKELCRIHETLCGDDLWLKAHEALVGTPTVLASDSIVHIKMEKVQETALWKKAPHEAHKDRLLKSLRQRYRNADGDVLLEALQRVVGDDLRIHEQNRDVLKAICRIHALKLMVDSSRPSPHLFSCADPELTELEKRERFKFIRDILNSINRFEAVRKTKIFENYSHELQNLDVSPVDSTALVAALREQVLRLPYIEDLKAESFVISALVDYGVGLSVEPYSGPWEELDNAHARIDLAGRWCDFALAHPELGGEYGKDLSQVLQNAADAVAREKKYGPRIDVKIYGTENSDLELRGVSGKGAKVETPEWLRKSRQPGVGYVIEPHCGQTEITLDFVCKTGGEFTAALRGANVTDKSGKRIPKWVTYTGLACNGEAVFEGEQRAWHDQPYRYGKTVAAGDAVTLEIRWRDAE